jgi:hypothetical protein
MGVVLHIKLELMPSKIRWTGLKSRVGTLGVKIETQRKKCLEILPVIKSRDRTNFFSPKVFPCKIMYVPKVSDTERVAFAYYRENKKL